MNRKNWLIGSFAVCVATLQMAGCPVTGGTSVIPGDTGDSASLGTVALVTVLSPQVSLSIAGGTPVELNWNAIATTNFSSVSIVFDLDETPDNGNEIVALQNLPITQNSALLDTSALPAGTYFIGVLLFQTNALATADYAPGRIIVNQQAQLTFTAPRDNLSFDRTVDTTPRFDVAWTVNDPDSIVSVELFLDPDGSPNGNEFKLRESSSQTGDSFAFDFPTEKFEPGAYRILAIVSDDVDSVAFYAPGSIRLRARLAGAVDLRDLGTIQSPIAGAVFEGVNPRDNLGSFVKSARDVDGDGFDEIMLVSQFGKPLFIVNRQRGGQGEAYLIYGRAQRFDGRININSTGTLFRGEIYTGAPEATINGGDPLRPSRGITSFAVLSDWDGDGLREFAFGVPFTDSISENNFAFAPLDPAGYFRSGVVVVASSSSLRPDLGFPGGNVMRLSSFGTIQHVSRTPIPLPVTCIDSFYGANNTSQNNQGAASLMHQHLPPIGGDADVLNGGSIRLGCRFATNNIFDQFGETISAFQFDSIIISAPNRDPFVSTLTVPVSAPGAGSVSVFFCDVAGGFYPWTSFNAPPAGAGWPGLIQTRGPALLPHGGPYRYIMDDFLARTTPTGFTLPGSPGYFVDSDHAAPCQTDTEAGAPGANNTLRIFSTQAGARLNNVLAADDFNGDGLQDILVGVPFANDGAGACYIVFGRLINLIRGGELDVAELALPLNSTVGRSRVIDGLQVRGVPGSRLGQAQDAAGDFNNDGLADVLIGSPLINNRAGGAAVLFGSVDLINVSETELSFDQIAERGLGVVFVGEGESDLAGARVSRAGDVDGDGIDDIMIAAPNRSVRLDIDRDGQVEIDRTNCGVVYLIYGSPDLSGTLLLADIGTERLPGVKFIGRNSGDFLGAGLGLQGDRSFGIAAGGDVDGDGRGDLLFGTPSATPRNRPQAGEVLLIYGAGD